MKSKWFEYKTQAIALRKKGKSITFIEKQLGVPRSTLSGWFKDVVLDEKQKAELYSNKLSALKLARPKAVMWHREEKQKRLQVAKQEASDTLDKLSDNSEILDLALAMLYWGEGAKNNSTSIASSDAQILKFVLAILKRNYPLDIIRVRCELHLRADQDPILIKKYWSEQLDLPLDKFRYIAFDKRTSSRKTYNSYKGVCVLYCGNIAIQRKLIHLYNQFSRHIIDNKGT